jgi:hypothetical protein
MQLTDQQIKDFQSLYKNHFGEEISREQALDKGKRLVWLVKSVLKKAE